MPYNRHFKFSLRKFKLGLASTVIGIGLAGPVIFAEEPQAPITEQSQVSPSTAQIDYFYVNYEDLTEQQRSLLKTEQEFHNEVVHGDKTYILVYQKEHGFLQLPKTGDQMHWLLPVLTGLGVAAIFLVRDRQSKQSLKVMIVLGVTSALLTGPVSQALELGISHFLQESHQGIFGDKLPDPQYRVGDRVFKYYLTLDTATVDATVQETLDHSAMLSDNQELTPVIESPSLSDEVTTATPDQSSEEEPTASTLPVVNTPETPALPTTPELPVAEPVVTESLVSLPFMTEYREDPSLPLGTEQLLQTGVLGQKRLIFTDGVLTSEEVLVAPQDEIILKGSDVAPVNNTPIEPVVPTEPVVPVDPEEPVSPEEPVVPEVSSEPVTPTEPEVVTTVMDEVIPYETESLDAPDLPLGTSEVVQAGRAGSRQLTYVNGELLSSQILQEPVKEIVRVGSRAPEVESLIVEEELPFETLYEEDANLAQGETEVIREGQVGIVERTYRDGQVVAEKVLRDPVDAVIKRGTKPLAGTTTLSRQELIPFETQTVADDSEYEDYTVVTQEGQDGLKEITEIFATDRGAIIGNPVASSEVILEDPISQIIHQGTKPIAGEEIETSVQDIPFEIQVIETDQLYLGDIEMVTQGQVGEKVVTTIYQTLKGVRQDNPTISEAVTMAVLDQVIRRGIKPLEGSVEVKTTKVLELEDQYLFSDDLYVGETEVVSEAVPGLQTITTTYKTIRGEQTNEVIDQPAEETTIAPQARVIKQGTKVRTEAEQQTPVGLNQTVTVGQVPAAEKSIDPSSVTNVKAYAWQAIPETAIVGTVSVTVLVTYTDDSVDEVPVSIDVVQDKTKPVLTLAALVEHDDDKKVTLNYDLEDPTDSFVEAKFDIYHGTTLVTSQAITSWDDLDVSNLDWYVPYTLKTTLVYDLGNGQETEHLDEVPFELEYKRVEIKHVDRVELYQRQADGNYQLVKALPSEPSDWTNYYAKVIDEQQKDIYLSVIAAEEESVDETPYFKLTATAPQLIEYKGQGTENQDNYHFYIPKEQVYTDGKYRSFTELIAAMRANPSGTFELGEDLNASEMPLTNGALSYVPDHFTGKLLGNSNRIDGLAAPLFHTLSGSFQVSDLALTNVAITAPSGSELGALAKFMDGRAGQSKVTNVAVQGTIAGVRSLGGLVYQARNTAFENIAFDGEIRTSTTNNINITGGLVAYLRNASSISQASVNATITVNAVSNFGNVHVGSVSGAVGESSGPQTKISQVVATGQVTNQADTAAHVGGLIGSVFTSSRSEDIVSSVDVSNGAALISNIANAQATPSATVVLVDGTQPGRTTGLQTVTAQTAKNQVDAMGITIDVADFIKPDINQYDVDYSLVTGYQSENQLKYANTEKLLPFYNKEFIVKQGNLIASGKLATDQVVAVIPMVGSEIIADYAGRQSEINKLLVRYADGSIEYLDLSYTEDFRDTALSEYAIAGTDLIYTPNHLTDHYQSTLAKVLPTLSAIDYYDPSLLEALNKEIGDSTVETLMDKLYLKDSFTSVKENLQDFLSGAIATSNIITMPNHELDQYILDNKEALLLGMAYVNRWYDFKFGELNAKDLLLYYQDFYGNKVDTLDWLIRLGKNYDRLNPANNLTTYGTEIAPYTGYHDLLSYLTANRQTLTDYTSDNDWFKATTKAHVVEAASQELPDQDVTVYSFLSVPSQQNGILPLLTTRGETFILTTIGGITYGMYDRYYGYDAIKNLATQAEKEAKIREMADQAAIWQRDHFDFWYRIALEDVRDRMIKPMVTWDGYQIPNGGKWLPMYGDEATNAIQDFFGPIGSRAHYANNGSGAIANGTTIYFMFNQVLDYYGSSVFTHEVVHNNDGSIYFGGYGRRFGLGAELFAQGFLQSPVSHDSANFVINTMYDYEAMGVADNGNRYHASSPERYQTADDLQEYFHGVFDVLYTLDYAEATVALANLSKDQQRGYFNTIENYYVTDPGTGEETHAGNRYRRFTEEEWADLDLATVYDLIDHNVVSYREHVLAAGQDSAELRRNGYYYAPLFSPNYAALSNDKGSPGDLMFRRMAFELLAEKGYEEGFIPYVSNQLAAEALSRGITGTETWQGRRTVGLITDELVLEVVFDKQYATWQEFKKAMFDQRIAKVANLKPITITYKDQERSLSSYGEIEALLQEALDEDVRRFLTLSPSTNINLNNRNYNSSSRVKEVKAKIFNAYLTLTDDFRESIYN
ncbi:ZmpA/ZmpB/ZmpC family metallo-endopeptidase [Streptococcus rifensis]